MSPVKKGPGTTKHYMSKRRRKPCVWRDKVKSKEGVGLGLKRNIPINHIHTTPHNKTHDQITFFWVDTKV